MHLQMKKNQYPKIFHEGLEIYLQKYVVPIIIKQWWKLTICIFCYKIKYKIKSEIFVVIIDTDYISLKHLWSVNELCRLIADAPKKQCELDPIPTWLLKDVLLTSFLFLMDMLNKSLCSREVSMALKKSVVTPILKKPKLDADDLANYRLVSSLPFISKLWEKVVAKRLSAYLDDNKLLPRRQSANRRFNSTETGTVMCSVGPDVSNEVGKVSTFNTFGYERCI